MKNCCCAWRGRVNYGAGILAGCLEGCPTSGKRQCQKLAGTGHQAVSDFAFRPEVMLVVKADADRRGSPRDTHGIERRINMKNCCCAWRERVKR